MSEPNRGHGVRAAQALAQRGRAVRAASLAICAPLTIEDHVVQCMPDVSPPKWHLAHTTWFFEAFVLKHALPDHRPVHPRYSFLFNSYYEAIGTRHARDRRGTLARPGVADILAYRAAVDAALDQLWERLLHPAAQAERERWLPVLEVGLNHEQQHQELLWMDILANHAAEPMAPVYKAPDADWEARLGQPARSLGWLGSAEAVVEVGHAGPGFAFDNESPRHRVLVGAHALADRLVVNGEYQAFVEAGGYGEARWWLSDGWAWVQREQVRAPVYWRGSAVDGWREFTLRGEVPLDAATPVVHVNGYEAEAFAAWWAAQHPTEPITRLPTEFEWEAMAASVPLGAQAHADTGRLHPAPVAGPVDHQVHGQVWCWTRSAYAPYPGFRPLPGALGEYNGKFMSAQWVLRGGSCVTWRDHARTTYRNFFYPHQRWAFSGIRLARDLA